MGLVVFNEWICSCCDVILGNSTWENIKAFCNSNFFTALFASLAGAFAGAYIAQRIAVRKERRKELLEEIRNTNAAIVLTLTICNSLLSLKKQHVKSLKENYESSRKIFIEQKQQYGECQINKVYTFKADLQSLPMTQLPIEILQKQVFEKLSPSGRPLSLVTLLLETIAWLNGSIDKRNHLIEEYKSVKDQILVLLYFGLPYEEGHVNLNYPNVINAIYSQTDDAIFYSHLLCSDLNQHGNKLSTEFKKKFGKGAPRVYNADFKNAQTLGLLPSEEAYTDFLNGFVEKE